MTIKEREDKLLNDKEYIEQNIETLNKKDLDKFIDFLYQLNTQDNF